MNAYGLTAGSNNGCESLGFRCPVFALASFAAASRC